MVQLTNFVVAALALSGFAFAHQPLEGRTFDICIPRKVYEAKLTASGHGKRTFFGKHPKICEDDEDEVDCKEPDMVWHHEKRTFFHKIHKKPCKPWTATEPCYGQPTTTKPVPVKPKPTEEPCDDDDVKPTKKPHTDREHPTHKPHKPTDEPCDDDDVKPTKKPHTDREHPTHKPHKPTDEPCDDDDKHSPKHTDKNPHHSKHTDREHPTHKPTTTRKPHKPTKPTDEPCDDDVTTTKKHGHHTTDRGHGHHTKDHSHHTTKTGNEPSPTTPCDETTTTVPTTTPCDETTTAHPTPTTTPCDETTTATTTTEKHAPTPTCDCKSKYEHVFKDLKVQISNLSPLLKKSGALCFDKKSFIGSSYASNVDQCLSLCDAKKGCTFVNTYKSGFLLKREAAERRTLFSDPKKAYTCDFYNQCFDKKGGFLGIDLGPIKLRDVSPAVEILEKRTEIEKRTFFVESEGFCKSGKY